MKKSIILNVFMSALFLIGCSSSGHEDSSQKGYSYSSFSYSLPSYNETVEVRVNFINGSSSVVDIEKGKKFIVEEHFEGFKAYTDDFYSKEYNPSNLKEPITLYLRENDGKNVLAIYDIVDGNPTRVSMGTYPSQSGLYPVDFEFQLYTNEGCSTPINLMEEIVIPQQGLKLYRRGKTNPDYFCITMRHYLDGIYDKEDDVVGALDYIISGYAFKANSGVPQSDWAYTTFQFDNGQNVDENTYYSFRTTDQVIINCYINRGEYRRVSVYDNDTGNLLGVIPWAIEESFFGTVEGYKYLTVVEWNYELGVARVSYVQKLIRNVLCQVYNGHVVRTWTNYAYQSEGFNYEYQERPFYFDIGLTREVEHTTYHTDITVYQSYR